MKEIKLFKTQIATWGSPLFIRAFDKNHAEGLTRILFKIPSDVGITATAEEEDVITLCIRCHSEEAEWIFGNEGFCQECWEAVCDESWWELCAPFWVEPKCV